MRKKIFSRESLIILFCTVFSVVVSSLIGIAAYWISINLASKTGVVTYSFQKTSSAVEGVSISYDATTSFLKIDIEDLEGTEAGINHTVGCLGHAINIDGDNRKIQDAYITFQYDPDKLRSVDPEDLGIATYDEASGRMVLLDNCTVDPEVCEVTGYTTHFSQYVLVDKEAWYQVWLQSQYLIRHAEGDKGYMIYIAYDCSGSMEGDKFALCKESICYFVDHVLDQDEMEIYIFDEEARYVSTFYEKWKYNPLAIRPEGMDRESVKKAVEETQIGNGTDLMAAINMVVNQEISKLPLDESVQDSQYLGKILILLTDGQSEIDEERLARCRELGVRIITVGVGSDVSEETLLQIAAQTGGVYVFAQSADDLLKAFQNLEKTAMGIVPDLKTDTDGDGIPDQIEESGMRNQYGVVIRTDPLLADTDGDGFSDREEMGSILTDTNVSEQDLAYGLTQYVFFRMQSDPTIYNGDAKVVPPQLEVQINTNRTQDADLEVTVEVSNPPAEEEMRRSYVKLSQFIVQQPLQNVKIEITYPECMKGQGSQGGQGQGSQGQENQSQGNQGQGNQGQGNQGQGNQGQGNQSQGNQGQENQSQGNQGQGNQGQGNQGQGNQSQGNQGQENQSQGNQGHGSQGQENQDQKYWVQKEVVGSIICGDEAVFPADYLAHEPEGEKDITWKYDKSLTIKSPMAFDGCTCDKEHIIQVTVTADNHEAVTLKKSFSLTEDNIYTINGNLNVKDTMTIGENCMVLVYGDMKVHSKGRLVMNSGSRLEVYGDFVFDSDTSHSEYLKEGTVNVHSGDVDLKRNYNSSGRHLLAIYGAKRGDHKLKLKNSALGNLYIDGALLDLKLELKSNARIDRIGLSGTAMSGEVDYYDGEARDLLDTFLKAVEKTGTAGPSDSPFLLTALNHISENNEEIESTVQMALMQWYMENRETDTEITEMKQIFSMLTGLPRANVNGVNIVPYGSLRYVENAVCGTANYKGYQYSFTPNEKAMKEAVASFTNKINVYAYSEIKKQVNSAMKHTGTAIGGDVVGNYFEAYSNLCFTVHDGKWKEFFKSLGVEDKLAKEISKNAPRIGNYVDFYEKHKNIFQYSKDLVNWAASPNGQICCIYQATDDLLKLQEEMLK